MAPKCPERHETRRHAGRWNTLCVLSAWIRNCGGRPARIKTLKHTHTHTQNARLSVCLTKVLLMRLGSDHFGHRNREQQNCFTLGLQLVLAAIARPLTTPVSLMMLMRIGDRCSSRACSEFNGSKSNASSSRVRNAAPQHANSFHLW